MRLYKHISISCIATRLSGLLTKQPSPKKINCGGEQAYDYDIYSVLGTEINK